LAFNRGANWSVMKRWTKSFLACSCFALCGSAASAQIIYSNIGPGFPADSGGNDAEGNTYFSTTFIATNGGNLNTLTMELDGTTQPYLPQVPGTRCYRLTPTENCAPGHTVSQWFNERESMPVNRRPLRV
jgi:hypothetical protein